MKKLLVVSVFLMLWSMQAFSSQSHPSQFSMPTAKQKAAMQAKMDARAQARSVVTPAQPAPAHRSLAPVNSPGKSRSARSHPFNNPPSNPPVNPVAFVSATQLAAGGGSFWSAVTADFTGSGRQDVAAPIAASYDSQTGIYTYAVSVILSNGNGTFQNAVLTPNPNGNFGDQILVGDVNGDGKADLIVVHSISPSTFEVWLGNGDGTFNVQNNHLNPISSNYPVAGVLTDLTGNGKLDLLIIDTQSPANMWTILGNGDGTFSQTPTSAPLTGGQLSDVVFADFNGDGLLDFAATDSNSRQTVVYLAHANGTYVAGAPLTNPDSVYDGCNNSAGDLNGDGKPEIVSANCGSALGPGNLTIYVNNGDGTFQTGVYYSAGTEAIDNTNADVYPLAVTIADINGDGNNDIVSSNVDGSDITVLLGNGDGTVKAPTEGFSAGGFPKTSALVADFNGDGFPDIIVPDDNFSFVYLQGYGDGTFRAAQDYYSPVSDSGWAYATTIASGDFNNDGYPDLVIGECCDNTVGVTVFLSNPNGSLQPGVNYGSGGNLEGVVVADFDGDGNLDFATSDFQNNLVQVFFGHGDGTFTASSPVSTGGTGSFVTVTGDFNQDGHPDLAVVNSNSTNITVSVLLNNGTGGFLPAVVYTVSNTVGNGNDIVAADVNNDGILDLVVTGQNNPGLLAVLLGNADGTFQTANTLSFAYNYLGNMALGDLDGDGKLDLAVAVDDNSVGTGLAIAKGNGDGTFQPAVLFSTTTQDVSLNPPAPGDVKMLDLKGNGKLDVIYSNLSYGTIGVLYNTGNPFGTGMFYDPVEYPAGGDVHSLVLADVNQDGAVDVVAADNDYAGATVLLNGSGSASSLSSSANPAVASQYLTFTSSVAATVRGITAVPTGSVTFFDGSTSLGVATMINGVAVWGISSLAVGTHSITAQYGGDSNFHSSTSTVYSEVITLATDSIGLISSMNPAPVAQSITFTATVSSASGGATATPTGSVSFLDGGALLGTTSVTSGVATFSTSSLAAGNHSITAQYSGDANFSGNSSGLTEAVVSPDFSLGATPPSISVNPGTPAQYTITVTPINGYNGTVTFSCGTLPATVTCTSFNPTSVTPSGAAVTTVLTLGTTAATASFVAPARPNSNPAAPTLWASLSGLGVFGLILAGTGRKRNRRIAILLGIMLLVMTFSFLGCGGGSNSNTGPLKGGTPAGNYTVALTAAGTGTGSPTHSMNITLVVQ
jgi:Big-like domain-containing protein/VCBS repeat protein